MSILNSHLPLVWVVIPAAGVGSRMQLDTPKQYLKIHNKTLIEHTLACFVDHAEIAGIVVVLNATDPYWKAINTNHFSKPVYTTTGGESRSDSVRQGLDFLRREVALADESWILVHDAARPYLLKEDIDALLCVRQSTAVGGILASPVQDTMKRVSLNSENNDIIERSENRDNLWHALTPQMFRLGDLSNALGICKSQQLQISDESSAMEYMGHHPRIVQGNHNNIKVTQASDIAFITYLLDELK